MGRKKLEIKPIENRYIRHVTFAKRRKGFLKKVEELSVLCDVQIAVIILSELNKLYQFSHGNSLAAILEQYYEVSNAAEREATGIQEAKLSKTARRRASKNLLQRVQRYLDELDLDELTVADLAQLVKEMETALMQTRTAMVSVNAQQMMEPIGILQEKEKLLREENELLRQQIAALGKEDIAPKEMENHREVDHSPQQQTLSLLL